jgi:hypothetical protein
MRPAKLSSVAESPNAEHMNVAAMFAMLVAEVRELRAAREGEWTQLETAYAALASAAVVDAGAAG